MQVRFTLHPAREPSPRLVGFRGHADRRFPSSPVILAASPGFALGDAYVIGMLFGGIALIAAIGALSQQKDRAFSASLVYLGLGLVAAVGTELIGVATLQPLEDALITERAAEFAVIIALFAAGLKLERPLNWNSWRYVARLLAIAMPLTIAAVALYGTQAMGLSLAGAIALGAVLAPTDPVLAGDIGVGPPGDEEEREPNFSITGEAGLNDGLAFPFVFLAVFVAESDGGGTDWLAEWFLSDVLYAIVVGVVLGAVLGYGLAALAVRLRDRKLFLTSFDGWLAPAAVLIIYGATEVTGAYGFLAAFAGGVAFRRYEYGHEYNRRVHDGAEMIEKFAELALVLVLASSVNLTGLAVPELSGWLLVPLLLLVIRPAAVLIALMRSGLPPGERAFVGWFGVRGIGSLYYVAVIIGEGVLPVAEERVLFWTVTITILASIVVHGLTASSLSRRWVPHGEADPHEPRGPIDPHEARGAVVTD